MDLHNDIKGQSPAASSYLDNGEEPNEQTFKQIEPSLLGNRLADLINTSTVLLKCDNTDDQICLTTSLNLQTQNDSNCTK